MTILFTIGLACLFIAAMARIVWFALKVGFVIFWAIPTFIFLFFVASWFNIWLPAIVAIVIILVFNREQMERTKTWM